MKIDELIKGSIYSTKSGNSYYVFRFTDILDFNTYYFCGRSFYKGSLDSRNNSSFKDYEVASKEECIQFEACEKQKRFISKDQALKEYKKFSNYLIY